MPRKNSTPDGDSSPENPIAASVHGTDIPKPGLLDSVRRFLRKVLITGFLLSLVVVPLLLYFTDIAPPVRKQMRKLVAEYSLYRKAKVDLNSANEKIAELEQMLATTKVESVAAPKPKVVDPVSQSQTVELPRNKTNEKVKTLRNGVTVRSYVDLQKGKNASRVRDQKEAYELETRLKINQPVANQSIDELAALNPDLPKMLPGLADMLEQGRVSPLFDKIYRLKIDRVVKELSSPEEMETRHNFFDCETILELIHPESKGKVLLMQGEMDVVADGTDGDRWPYLNEAVASSAYFQHASSYRWKKVTKQPNPLLARAEKELKKVLTRYAVKGLSKSENARLKSRRDELRRQIREMQSTSFLVAEVDPFIVLPLSFLKQSQLTHAPAIGDFAVVIYRDKLYPAICGDAGPSWKLGEGSLFLARTLNSKSSPNYRPVSDLKVSYLVFPGTKPEKSVPPNLIDWRKKCGELLKGIGGLGSDYQLHNWRDLPAERKATEELKGIVGAYKSIIEKRDKAVSEAKKELAAAVGKVAELKKKIVELEALAKKEQEEKDAAAESEEEADEEKVETVKDDEQEKVDPAQKIREEWLAAEALKTDLETEVKLAEQSLANAKDLSAQTNAAITKAQAIEKLPESTSRELSTDIILAALTESKAAIDSLKEE